MSALARRGATQRLRSCLSLTFRNRQGLRRLRPSTSAQGRERSRTANGHKRQAPEILPTASIPRPCPEGPSRARQKCLRHVHRVVTAPLASLSKTNPSTILCFHQLGGFVSSFEASSFPGTFRRRPGEGRRKPPEPVPNLETRHFPRGARLRPRRSPLGRVASKIPEQRNGPAFVAIRPIYHIVKPLSRPIQGGAISRAGVGPGLAPALHRHSRKSGSPR